MTGEAADELSEPHFVVGLPINPGKTIEDVQKSLTMEEGEGEAPYD